MILDSQLNFGLPTITNSTSATASPEASRLDLGSSKKFFTGRRPLWLWFRATITADADPTIKVDLVGSDESDLDPDNSEATNTVIASTGVIEMKDDGSAVLASGDTVERAIQVGVQKVARRYYGLIVTLGGTNPDLAAGQDAAVVTVAQTHLIGAQAAVPAT